MNAKFCRSMLLMFRFDAVGGRTPDGQKVGGKFRILQDGALLSVPSSAVIARGRNEMMREFLKIVTKPDWLLMLDTDMTFEPDLAEALIASAHPTERPIVGGLCFAYMSDHERKLWPTLYGWVPGSERLRRLVKYPLDSMVQVAATGGACVLIHRTVIEAMAAKYPPPRPWFDETPFYAKDANGDIIPASGDEYSEDITFCLRAQACGFPVYVNTAVKLGHVKTFEADEPGFLRESAVLAEAMKPTLPTFAVIASKDRPEMLATVANQLADQVTRLFVMDNGYDPPLPPTPEEMPVTVVPCHGWSLHRMWNHGLHLAYVAAEGQRHNVLVCNDDIEVPNELCAQLEAGLRSTDDVWIAYPDPLGNIPNGQVVQFENPDMAGQTMTGWCHMLRGEVGLTYDEGYAWWYGDSELELEVRERGKRVAAVGGCRAVHLDPLRSTITDPVRLAEARGDEAAFAARHGIDPSTLWLARHQPQEVSA